MLLFGIAFVLYFFKCNVWLDLVPFVQFKNVKSTHGGVLLLVLKVTFLNGCFSRVLNCSNGTKSRKTSQMFS